MNQSDPPTTEPCNPEQLFNELLSAGLPIESIDETGAAVFKRSLTESETHLAVQLIKDHNPQQITQTLSEALINAGISPEVRLEALWKAVIEQDVEDALELQQTITTIKARRANEPD